MAHRQAPTVRLGRSLVKSLNLLGIQLCVWSSSARRPPVLAGGFPGRWLSRRFLPPVPGPEALPALSTRGRYAPRFPWTPPRLPRRPALRGWRPHPRSAQRRRNCRRAQPGLGGAPKSPEVLSGRGVRARGAVYPLARPRGSTEHSASLRTGCKPTAPNTVSRGGSMQAGLGDTGGHTLRREAAVRRR